MSLLGLCSALLACSGRADIPDTPDLTYLQNEFNSPTASLDETTVGEAIIQMPSLRELAAAFRAAGGHTTRDIQAGGGEGSPPAGSRINIQGAIHVTARCPGALDTPAFGPNGSVSLTLGVQQNLIKRGIKIEASDCAFQGNAFGTTIPVVLDGPVYLDLGRDLGLKQRFSGRLLMYVAGTLDVNGLLLDNLAARWTDESLEYLFRMPAEDDKWIIAVLGADGSLTIKDRNSTWGCSDGQACARE